MPDWGQAGQGALGGAAMGAVAGSVVPGIGTGLGALGGGLIGGLGGLFGGGSPRLDNNPYGQVDPQGHLGANARAAGSMANTLGRAQGASRAAMQQAGALMHDRALGNNLVSTEQLRQGLQQNLGHQMAMAAGARPNNSAMAARNASMQAANLGAGMSGQAALAGAQEANMALGQMGNLYGQMRNQDIQGMLGSRGQALQGQQALESARTARFGAVMEAPTWMEGMMGGLASTLPLMGKK